MNTSSCSDEAQGVRIVSWASTGTPTRRMASSTVVEVLAAVAPVLRPRPVADGVLEPLGGGGGVRVGAEEVGHSGRWTRVPVAVRKYAPRDSRRLELVDRSLMGAECAQGPKQSIATSSVAPGSRRVRPRLRFIWW